MAYVPPSTYVRGEKRESIFVMVQWMEKKGMHTRLWEHMHAHLDVHQDLLQRVLAALGVLLLLVILLALGVLGLLLLLLLLGCSLSHCCLRDSECGAKRYQVEEQWGEKAIEVDQINGMRCGAKWQLAIQTVRARCLMLQGATLVNAPLDLCNVM